ncbi:SDR family oxidoreductase [Paraburkholderia sp. J63]|uniref:SDR family oxidoreductase n=1 Tax=Paraburkholderia sp. J63 TaxID=2805434 RepID=UPI002ABDF6BE|nr:SDR family oxidoreductase [Paraburkholderia sp. J63]
MKTVLITGCSSGFGLETARYFLERDWNVVATMRMPREDVLPRSARLRVLALDVTDPRSIREAVDAAGPVDVLVNNAGVGLLSAFEGTSMETVRQVFETNTFGTLAMTHALLPQFTHRRSGTIINVASAVTLKSFPLLSIYTASKAAIAAFTESLALELEAFDVRVGLILPGRAPETRFGENVQRLMPNGIPQTYEAFAHAALAKVEQVDAVTHSLDVAQAVWRFATDIACPARLPAGADAVAIAESR